MCMLILKTCGKTITESYLLYRVVRVFLKSERTTKKCTTVEFPNLRAPNYDGGEKKKFLNLSL